MPIKQKGIYGRILEDKRLKGYNKAIRGYKVIKTKQERDLSPQKDYRHELLSTKNSF